MDAQDEKVWNILKDASSAEKPSVFLDYCRIIQKLKETGEYSVRYAAYRICAASFFPELIKTSTIKAVLDFACDLELPENARPIRGSEEKLWIQLVALINSAASSIEAHSKQR